MLHVQLLFFLFGHYFVFCVAAPQDLIKSSDLIKWVKAQDGSIPEGAFPGGKEKGEVTYICKAIAGDEELPGKVSPAWKNCIVSNDGKKIKVNTYKVLVAKDAKKLHWATSGCGSRPLGAVTGGKTTDGNLLYIGRIKDKKSGNIILGKYHSLIGATYVVTGGKEKKHEVYQILTTNSGEVEDDDETPC